MSTIQWWWLGDTDSQGINGQSIGLVEISGIQALAPK